MVVNNKNLERIFEARSQIYDVHPFHYVATSIDELRCLLIVPDGTTDTGSAIYAIGVDLADMWLNAADRMEIK